MHLRVRHRTSYRFDQPQQRLVQLTRLTPPSFAGQTVIGWEIGLDCDARLRPARDGYGNDLTMIYVDGPISALTIDVAGEVLTEDRAGIVQGGAEPLPAAVFLRDTALTRADAAIVALADEACAAEDKTLARLHALNRLLAERMRFDTGGMDVALAAADALGRGHGVCQDFAHVFSAAAPSMGVPARYVSGHLFRRDGETDQPAAHAWAEAYLGDIGWVGFDPANGISPDDAYIRVAVGLDYREAAPIAGARVGFGTETLDVAVSVVEAGIQRQD